MSVLVLSNRIILRGCKTNEVRRFWWEQEEVTGSTNFWSESGHQLGIITYNLWPSCLLFTLVAARVVEIIYLAAIRDSCSCRGRCGKTDCGFRGSRNVWWMVVPQHHCMPPPAVWTIICLSFISSDHPIYMFVTLCVLIVGCRRRSSNCKNALPISSMQLASLSLEWHSSIPGPPAAGKSIGIFIGANYSWRNYEFESRYLFMGHL